MNNDIYKSNLFNEEAFEYLISQLSQTYYFGCNDFSNEYELVNIWIKIGNLLNIDHILPNQKLIVNKENEEEEPKVLSFIATSSKKVLEDITDPDIFDEEMVHKCLVAIENKKKEYN